MKISSVRAGRHGAASLVAGLLTMITAAAAVVLAVSGQSSSTRAVLFGATLGRAAEELAESAITEALADFEETGELQTGGADMRPVLTAQAVDGVVPGATVLVRANIGYRAERTLDLIKSERLPVTVSEVVITPLYYRVPENYGKVELSCAATYKLPQGRTASRRVIVHHFFSLEADGKTFHVNEVATQRVVDRSGE